MFNNYVWRTVRYLKLFTELLLGSDLTDASLMQSLWETPTRRENQNQSKAGNLLTIRRIVP